MSNPLLDTASLPRFDDIKPEHAVPALTELIAANREKLEQLLEQSGQPDFDSLVRPVEEMQHELGRVWSPVSHLQSVVDSTDWRTAYNSALPLLTEYGTELSQNGRLQEAYQQIADELPPEATAAERRVLEHALREFRLAGVALPKADKARFRDIMQRIAALQAAFAQNVQDATDNWSHHVKTAGEVAGLPAQTTARAAADARSRDLDGWLLKLDYPTYHAVMTHADSAKLRERFYRAWATRASDQGDDRWNNSDNIRQILELRHEAAALVGFDNYAEYSLATKMAGSVDEVINFLRELASKSRDAAIAELEEIRKFAGCDVNAWDTAYYLEKLKSSRFAVSDEKLRQYFPFHVVSEGMFGVAEKLYGVTVSGQADVSRWHDTVNYFEIHDREGNLIGSFFTDLFAREGKRGGAWMDECVVRKSIGGKQEAPVGYLVCNFPPPDIDGLSLITHNDVVTLFHEFGHMLHHLLTTVDYPSIAGINGVPWDAVELPSQFMENFAWQYDVLLQSSRHFETGEALPREIFDRMESGRQFGEALAMLRQIEFALFDFRLHAEYDPASPANPIDVLMKVRDEVAVIEHPEYNRMPYSFSHIFAGGYAAGYYSYKWAEVLAADAFSAFEDHGVFDSSIAQRFRREILEIGGSRDFMDAYVAFRGREPTLEALLKQSGIGQAA